MAAPLVVILAGGSGTRIQHLLLGLPKPLAPVAGRPFLDWLIRYLRRQGLARIVISAGYRSEKLAEFSKGAGVECVVESEPLGTGGGFVHALAGAGDADSDVIACNGDSLVLADFAPLREAMRDPSVDAAILGVQVADATRFGTIEVDGRGFLKHFSEKHPGAGLVNAGVYLFRRATVARFPAKRPLSFEYDVFPYLVSQNARIRVVSCVAPFLDIGTEQSLSQADTFIRGNRDWFE